MRSDATPEGDLIAEMQRLADELGRPPTCDDMNEHGEYSNTPYYNRWGSWADAREAAGLTPGKTRRDAIPKGKLLKEIKRLKSEGGRVPRLEDLEAHGRFSADPFKRAFGSWADALTAAGYDHDRGREYRVADWKLAWELRRLNNLTNGPITSATLKSYSDYGPKPFRRVFGSLAMALEAAGLEPTDRQIDLAEGRQSVRRNALIQELHRLAEEYGDPPRSVEMYLHGQYSRERYTREFGSWGQALEAAGYEPWGERGDYTVPYSTSWKRLREERLEMDNHTCQICGLDREEHYEKYGWGPEVHHIQKVKLHDQPEDADYLDNLITLCRKCHGRWEGIPLKPL